MVSKVNAPFLKWNLGMLEIKNSVAQPQGHYLNKKSTVRAVCDHLKTNFFNSQGQTSHCKPYQFLPLHQTSLHLQTMENTIVLIWRSENCLACMKSEIHLKIFVCVVRKSVLFCQWWPYRIACFYTIRCGAGKLNFSNDPWWKGMNSFIV